MYNIYIYTHTSRYIAGVYPAISYSFYTCGGIPMNYFIKFDALTHFDA